MSYYVYGTHISYHDYLQAKSFVADIQSGQRVIVGAMSRQTREIVASQQELHAEGMRALGSGLGQLSEGLESISCQLDDIHDAVRDLDATFHWGFTQMLAGMGRLNDSLEQLISIAKTPAQTWAYNQYEIARDAMRRKLYPEALESLNNAINGFGSNPGYKLEYRFHHARGIILLGSADNCDQRILDLPKAEQSFLTAARYARADYQKEAGLAFLAAGWSAYCQGKMEEAVAHTQDAIKMDPNLAEALFQLAKINMHLGKVDSALRLLGKAMASDRKYSLKAAADGDFQKHSERLRTFLDECRGQARRYAEDAIKLANREIRAMKEWHADQTSKVDYDAAISSFRLAQGCFAHQTLFGYLDAREEGKNATSAAQRAIQARESALEGRFDELFREITETRNRVKLRAPLHSPSAWGDAEEEYSRLGAMDSEPHTYEGWVAIVRQAKVTRDITAKVATLTDERERACDAVTSREENLRASAGELSLNCAWVTFYIVGIACYILLITSAETRWGTVLAVLFGWCGGALIGLCVALVVWLVAYIAFWSGIIGLCVTAVKRTPPKA